VVDPGFYTTRGDINVREDRLWEEAGLPAGGVHGGCPCGGAGLGAGAPWELRSPSEFAPIRETLAGIPLKRISQALGVSMTAASKIRSGQLVPDVRHWESLSELASVQLSRNP
jgi:hypothetical protein